MSQCYDICLILANFPDNNNYSHVLVDKQDQTVTLLCNDKPEVEGRIIRPMRLKTILVLEDKIITSGRIKNITPGLCLSTTPLLCVGHYYHHV